MSLVASCDHEVIVSSQNTVKILHEAKIVASKHLTSAHSLRDSYKVRVLPTCLHIIINIPKPQVWPVLVISLLFFNFSVKVL